MQNADEIENLLFNDEPIRENVYIYYKKRNESANCIQLKSISEDNLDKLSWIYGDRKKQRWRLAEYVDANGENLPTRQVYVNLHRETGLKHYTVQEDISHHDDLLTRYNNNDPAYGTVVESNGELEFLSVAEAERRLEKLGKVEYLKNNQLLNKEMNKDDEMGVDLEIVNTEFAVQESQNLPEVSFYSQMDVNGIFNAQPEFESNEFYSKDMSCRKSVKQVLGAGRITLKRLMILVLEDFYAIYLWLIAMTIVDQNSQHSSFEAQVFCWTSAQHCLEVMQMVCDTFKIKMLLKDSELLVISPQSQVVEYTFVLSQKGLPMIYSGDRFPGTVNEMAANVMEDFAAHNRFTQVRDMEEVLLERIHAAVLRMRDGNTEEDSDLEQVTRETTSERMTDAFGSGKKRGRKSNYFNFADDLPSIRSSPRKGNGVNLKETKMFSLMTVLKAPSEAQNLARDLFDVSRDDAPHSTRLEANKTRDEHVRERRRSRSRELDTDGSASRKTSRSRSGSRVQFSSGPSQNRAASIAGTNTLAAQCVLNITNPDAVSYTHLTLPTKA